MFALLPVTIALLLAPIEILEERSLNDRTPVSETITVRGLWPHPDNDALALLPRSLAAPSPRPVVHLVGRARPLELRATPNGWAAVIPFTHRRTVRLVATVTLAVETTGLFRLSWPAIIPSDVPTRYVATVPRRLLDGPASLSWVCPDTGLHLRDCVSRDRHPAALVTRWIAPHSPRFTLALALAFAALTLTLITRSPHRRAERLLASLGGLAVSLSLSLSLVGAGLLSWGPALLVTLSPSTLIASHAPLHPRGRLFGALALITVPLVSVVGAPWGLVVCVSLVFALLCLEDLA